MYLADTDNSTIENERKLDNTDIELDISPNPKILLTPGRILEKRDLKSRTTSAIIPISIIADVRSNTSFTPEVSNLGFVEKNAPIKCDIIVSNKVLKDKFKIYKIEVSQKKLKAHIFRIDDGVFKISVAGIPETKTGVPFEAIVKITTNDQSSPEQFHQILGATVSLAPCCGGHS